VESTRRTTQGALPKLGEDDETKKGRIRGLCFHDIHAFNLAMLSNTRLAADAEPGVPLCKSLRGKVPSGNDLFASQAQEQNTVHMAKYLARHSAGEEGDDLVGG
jgi:hypothetical protein